LNSRMTHFATIALSVAAGAALTLVIPSLYAQSPAPPGAPAALVMQAAAQTSSAVMPVTFVLDLATRKLKACRAPSFGPEAGPVCSSWTLLGS
jgi:hypothetical protein